MSKQNTAIIPGSLSAIAQQSSKPLAETFLNVDLLILVDMSGSMESHDAPGGKSRYQAAEEELARIQGMQPGKIGVIAFSSYPVFCPGGIPTRLGGSTDMAEALKFVKAADDCGIRFILISDGQPDSGPETLQVAKRFKTKIDTVYIGPEADLMGGRKFLEQLAAATGGKSIKSDAPGMLGKPVERLLLEG